jgi:hypothetical protein
MAQWMEQATSHTFRNATSGSGQPLVHPFLPLVENLQTWAPHDLTLQGPVRR